MKILTSMIVLATLFATGGVLFAEGPPGLQKQGRIPPGFSHGRKMGWQNEYPPGWEKKTEVEKNQWKQGMKKGRDSVLEKAREKGFNPQEVNSAADDFEWAARMGLNPEEAERVVKDKMAKGKKGKALSISAAEETEVHLKEVADQAKKNKETGKNKGKGKVKKK
jgi:hypothetical protein